MRIPHRSPLHKLFNSEQFLKSTPFTALPKTPSSPTHRIPFSALPSKPISRIHPLDLRTSWTPYASYISVPPSVHSDNPRDSVQMGVMRRKLKKFRFDNDFCKPGQHRLICPQCKGGDSSKKSLTLFILPDWSSAVWNCFRANCGLKGSTQAYADTKSGSMIRSPKVKHEREITEESLELEPLCDSVVEMKKSNKDVNVNEIKRREWSEEMDDILLDALLEQQENGNRVDGTLASPVANSNVVKICSQKLGYPVDKHDVKNRMITLKMNFNTCFKLFKNLSGISWSPETKLFEAEPEVWKALVEAKPSASKWRHTKINNYGKLYELFAKDRANDQGFVCANEKVCTWATDNGTSTDSNLDNYESNSDCGESSKGTKRKGLMVGLFGKEIEVIGSGINKVAETIEKRNLVAERGLEIAAKIVAIAEKARADYHSDEEVFAELVNIGVPDCIQLDAFLFLLKCSQHKSAFFGVPSERRLELLYKMMEVLRGKNPKKSQAGYNPPPAIPLPPRATLFFSLITCHYASNIYSGHFNMCSNSAVWNCFRTNCGWKGCTQYADSKSGSMIQNPKVKHKREITEKSLELEPLCAEILDYFAERKISGETLRRNCVMQRKLDDKIVIAFTYRQNGALVSCKYRDVNKKFWQEKDTEKIFYGLDDISNTSDIIIVEGEVDKLAMEEAGFRNCVSVPDGAAPPVSTKEFFQSADQDTKYQYLWNCKEYLEKASRIILATDGDRPGQALAEELARRLGRERCWQVSWPKNFKDANEVLMFMGPDALKKVIEKAELYPIRGLFNFKDDSDEIDAYHH
ncbi:uncharacterized protein LOC132280134 [Cornus florida]|uniref:uncharacterized protein LOC132280134 n=1 Tax=Cornus florida TaxID=4283 RepID=UPI002897A8B5|nr:uncharacterized protein LOC132280134 [Cornus florida]